MGILVKTAASMQDVKELLEPINENIDSLKGSVSSINEEISNLEEKKINSIKVLEGEEYKATDGKIDISPSVEPIKSATESNDNAIKVLGDKVYNLDGTRLLIEHGTEITIKDYIDKKIEEQLLLIQEQVNRVEGEISYIVCTDIRTEDNAVITLQTNIAITELKDGMTISFSPRYHSQGNCRIKINNLAEVGLVIGIGYLSMLATIPVTLVYRQQDNVFIDTRYMHHYGVAADLGLDMDELLYDAEFYYYDLPTIKNISSDITGGNGWIRIINMSNEYVIQLVQLYGEDIEYGVYYSRRGGLIDGGGTQWTAWVKGSGIVPTHLMPEIVKINSQGNKNS